MLFDRTTWHAAPPRVRDAAYEFVGQKIFSKAETKTAAELIRALEDAEANGFGRVPANSYTRVQPEYMHKKVGGLLKEIHCRAYEMVGFYVKNTPDIPLH